jgi:hypothetical protein
VYPYFFEGYTERESESLQVKQAQREWE